MHLIMYMLWTVVPYLAGDVQSDGLNTLPSRTTYPSVADDVPSLPEDVLVHLVSLLCFNFSYT